MSDHLALALERRRLESRIKNLRVRLWADPGDKRDVQDLIDEAVATRSQAIDAPRALRRALAGSGPAASSPSPLVRCFRRLAATASQRSRC
jgi:hypothetical protein